MIPFSFEDKETTGGTGSGGDNHLASLTVSVGTLTPAFAINTFSYTVSVANGVTSVSVTPTRNVVGEVITVNGRTVASGAASGAISLPVGATTITIGVNGGGATQNYTVTVTRAAAAGNSPPSPAGWTYAFGVSGGGHISQTVSNPNATAMTLNFGPWQTAGFAWGNSSNPPSWITTFPLVIPANSSALLTLVLQGLITNRSESLGGTWQCGSDSGTISATGTSSAGRF